MFAGRILVTICGHPAEMATSTGYSCLSRSLVVCRSIPAPPDVGPAHTRSRRCTGPALHTSSRVSRAQEEGVAPAMSSKRPQVTTTAASRQQPAPPLSGGTGGVAPSEAAAGPAIHHDARGVTRPSEDVSKARAAPAISNDVLAHGR